jgi:formylglycine-generating enzyme required for sulfatase activity
MFRSLPLVLVAAMSLAAFAPVRAEESAPPAPPAGMVYVAGGTFVMGLDVEGEPTNETPAHPVELAPFFIDRYEATNARFAKFIEAKGYENTGFWSEDGRKWLSTAKRRLPEDWEDLQKSLGKDFAQHPVVGISWFEAEAFAKFEGCRLPTEAEWERAARGRDGRVYPWGNEFKAGFNEAMDPAVRTRTVGFNPADVSAEGLFDMGGNVAEWTASRYEGYPGTKYVGRWWGPDAKRYFRVARGGSWRDLSLGTRAAEHGFRVTRRLWEYGQEGGRSFMGVRLAKSAAE